MGHYLGTLSELFSNSRFQFVWIVYLSLGVSLVLSLLYLANFLDIKFFILVNRGMIEQGISNSLFSPILDTLIWVISIFLVASLVFYRLYRSAISVASRFTFYVIGLFVVGLTILVVFNVVSLVLLCLVSVLLFLLCFAFSKQVFEVGRFGLFVRLIFGATFPILLVELSALILYNAPLAVNLTPNPFSWAIHWNNVQLSLSHLSYPLLLPTYLVFISLGILAFISKSLRVKWLTEKIKTEVVSKLSERLDSVLSLKNGLEVGLLNNRWVIFFAVVVSAAVSCLFVIFTVVPWTNPTGMLVSVDSPSYFTWIDHMHSLDVNNALSFAFSNDRALFLVLGYGLSFFTSPVVVLQLISAFLIVAFGLVTFLLLRLVIGVRSVWVIGSLLVPFSFQSLGLIYSGYFANMLALTLVFVYIVLFFRLLNRWSTLGFFGLLLVSACILFSHSWTWVIFALSLVLFLFLEWRQSAVRVDFGRFKMMSVYIAFTLAVGLFCDFSRGLLGPVSSYASVVGTAKTSLGLPNAGFIVAELGDAVSFVLGGVFSSFILILLAIVGFVVLLRLKSPISRFLLCWVFIGCVSILFAGEGFVFDRSLFLVPWVVFCALGLFFVVSSFINQIGSERWRFWLFLCLLTVIFLELLNSSLGYVFNINIL